jgi:hypothetical protein
MQEEETATEEDHGGYEQQQDQHVLSDDAGRLEESVLPNRRDGRIEHPTVLGAQVELLSQIRIAIRASLWEGGVITHIVAGHDSQL